MLKRILIVWAIANFVIIGSVCWLAGGWYLGWDVSPAIRMLAELGLVMLPNLLLPVLVLRSGWPESIASLRQALGWQWSGWRGLLSGLVAFLAFYLLLKGIVSLLGAGIPDNLPGASGEGIEMRQASDILKILGLLFGLATFMIVTVAGEETMFRGWIQTHSLPICSTAASGRPRLRCGSPGRRNYIFLRSV